MGGKGACVPSVIPEAEAEEEVTRQYAPEACEGTPFPHLE